MVFTKLEAEMLRAAMIELGVSSNAWQGPSTQAYELYQLADGKYVYVCVSGMSAEAARECAQQAEEDVKPDHLIIVGIGWGGIESEQQIGDVLIATQIQYGTNAKISEPDGLSKVEFREAKPGLKANMSSLMQSSASSLGVRFHSGPIISKTDLFDHKGIRDAAVKAVPGCIGGEMEAEGVHRVLKKATLTVVKGISDWGYRKNEVSGHQKTIDQELAARNAMAVVLNALEGQRFPRVISRRGRAALNQSTDQSPDKHATSDLNKLLRASDRKIEISRLPSGFELSDCGVFWPVRLRKPNVIHAAQAFTAALLAKQGATVFLAIDDLGEIDGYTSSEAGIRDFQDSVRRWLEAASASSDLGSKIVSESQLFSTALASKKKSAPTLAALGRNIVEWLVRESQLQSVLKQSKLLGADGAALLERRPRRLLTPPVIWTIFDRVVADQRKKFWLTLGGLDEQSTWEGFPSDSRGPVVNLYLPILEGDMDATGFRPATAEALDRQIAKVPSFTWWVSEFLVSLPSQCADQEGRRDGAKLATNGRTLGQAAFDFYS